MSFLRKKRRAKRTNKKATRKKPNAARARSRLDDLTLSAFNVCIEAVNKVHGIGPNQHPAETLGCKGLWRLWAARD